MRLLSRECRLYLSRRKTGEKADRENTKCEAGARVLDLPRPPSIEFPVSFSFSVQTWAITWVRQIKPLHRTFRNEPDDSYHEVDAAIVSYQVS